MALEGIDAKGKVNSHRTIPSALQFYGHDSTKLLIAFQSATIHAQNAGLQDLTGLIADMDNTFYHGSIPAEGGRSAPWVICSGAEDRILDLMDSYLLPAVQEPEPRNV